MSKPTRSVADLAAQLRDAEHVDRVVGGRAAGATLADVRRALHEHPSTAQARHAAGGGR